MTIYNSAQRFSLALLAACALTGVYLGVRLASSMMLDVDRKVAQPPAVGQEPVPEFRQDVAHWFPEDSWVQSAESHFRDNGRYLICQTIDLFDDDRRVVVKPVAMLWRAENSKPNDVPITVIAESAQLLGTERFISDTGEFGKIKAGALLGNVRIDGPQGLKIVGNTFRLSQDSMRLESGNPVRFEWNGHSGIAHSGIDIELSTESNKDGLTDVRDVKKIQLLGLVECTFVVPGKRLGDPINTFMVTAPGGFEYRVLEKTAKFKVGPNPTNSLTLDPRNDVVVKQKTKGGWDNKLICPELRFSLRQALSETDGTPEKDGLELAYVEAWGRRVFFESKEHKTTLDANRLKYRPDLKRFDIQQVKSMEGQSANIRLTRDTMVLEVPHIQVLHNADDEIQRVECIGAGTIKGELPGELMADMPASVKTASKPATDQPSKVAMGWAESLIIQRSPDGLLSAAQLNGRAFISELSNRMLLSANRITARIRHDETKQESSGNQAAGIAQLGFAEQLDPANLKPELLTAEGNVKINSTQGTGKVRDKLTVRFEDGPASPSDIQQVSSTKSESKSKQDKKPQLIHFAANTLSVRVRDLPDDKFSFEDMWLTGDVNVDRLRQDGKLEFRASGQKLFAKSGLANQREIQLFGDPAKVESPRGKFASQRIDLREVGQQADALGSGSIRFMSKQGLDKKPLKEPVPVDIFWSDRMVFGESSARFYGKIRIVMEDESKQTVEVKCTGLTVEFSGDLSISPRGDDGSYTTLGSDSSAALNRILCHNKVDVTIKQFTDGELTGRHVAEFADLEVNMKTGDFSALGWGQLISVVPDEDGRLQAPAPVAARANSPAQARRSAFVRMKTEFIGTLSGNFNQKVVRLTQNVVTSLAPARHLDDVINVDTMPPEKMPEGAGVLQADEITISSVGKSLTDQPAFEVVARKNARLEGKLLSARADIIQYDNSKQQFKMQALGDSLISVTQRTERTGKYNNSTAKSCEYYPLTGRIRGDFKRLTLDDLKLPRR